MNQEERKYKKYILPCVILFSSIVVFFQIFLPQFFQTIETLKKINEKNKELVKYKETLSFVNGLNNDLLDKDLSVVSTALPSGKDILTVFSGISNVGLKSGVNVSGFSVALGQVFEKSKNNPAQEAKGTIEGGINTSIPLSVRLEGVDLDKMVDYINNLYIGLPISEAKKINLTEGSATLDLNFFYKPYDLFSLSSTDQVKPLLKPQEDLLKLLKEWFEKKN